MFNFCLKEGQKEQKKKICGDTAGITDSFAKWQLFLSYYILSVSFPSKQKEICLESNPL